MGNRSDRRIFRRRRRRAGFALTAALAVVVLGGLLFFTANPARETAAGSFVERVETPAFAAAPSVVKEVEEESVPAEEKAAAETSEKKEAGAGGSANEQQPAAKKEPEPEKPAGPPPPENPTLYLTVPKMGLYNNVVANSSEPTALDYGAAKLEQSGFPWQNGANTYISAHRLGWPGTASDHQFYNLPLMDYGDEIYLTDTNGTTYTYQVTEILEVSPQDAWVSNPVADRNMVSLQTCTEDYGDYWTMGPDWATRFVVRADKVDVTHA